MRRNSERPSRRCASRKYSAAGVSVGVGARVAVAAGRSVGDSTEAGAEEQAANRQTTISGATTLAAARLILYLALAPAPRFLRRAEVEDVGVVDEDALPDDWVGSVEREEVDELAVVGH